MIGLMAIYLLFKVFGWWAFLLILVFPRSWRILQRTLSHFRITKPPKPQDLSERLFMALDPAHPTIRRHLGRMPVFTSSDVGFLPWLDLCHLFRPAGGC